MIKKCGLIIIYAFFLMLGSCDNGYHKNQIRKNCLNPAFEELPLGSIKPTGWLYEQMLGLKNGLTGHLDEIYPVIFGERNGWLGGDGDGWERGPYWIDGLLPLAYQLDDEQLKEKALRWVEWSLNNQQKNGYFGPIPFEQDPEPEPSLQKTNREDWWPKMVMLKVLKQYYSATDDQRVIDLMTRYFHYQLKELPVRPLGELTYWGQRRGGENLLMVCWLYGITHDPKLIELSKILIEQTYPWTEKFLERELLTVIEGKLVEDEGINPNDKTQLHCVNLAMGLKQPVVCYLLDGDEKHLIAVENALKDIRKFHGMPMGLYGADEHMHGNNPVNGSELCTAVEMMYSLEKNLEITGNQSFAELLEKVAFNALPTQISEDFNYRQYFQMANQVMITRHTRNFFEEHDGTDCLFGQHTGYMCCTANLHQGWPKFTQHLWFKTSDNGLAAFLYSPCKVTTTVGRNNIPITIEEETNYPFEEVINFKISLKSPEKFKLLLRKPSWCNDYRITINNEPLTDYEITEDGIIKIERKWENRDNIKLEMDMHIYFSKWYENSISVERGPLTYVLKIQEERKFYEDEYWGKYWEIYPKSPWNYGLLMYAINSPEEHFKVIKKEGKLTQPWTPDNSPVVIKTKGMKIPLWKIYNETSGPLPSSPIQYLEKFNPEEEIILIPYGCSTLRISEFPVIIE